MQKPALNEVKTLIQRIINEVSYQGHLDTHYSSDGMDDYSADKAYHKKIEKLYDAGKVVYDLGEKVLGNKIRERVLKLANSSDWSENELPPY